MHVFIDCGAYKGNAIRKFMASTDKAWRIHAFEPNTHIKRDYPNGTIVHNEAVWIEDGVIPFYFSTKGYKRSSSSAMKNKTSGNLNHKKPEIVPCIDFSKWLLHNFEDDNIVLKMDIEGAEYQVLRKMLNDGSISLINTLYIEFHAHKIDMDKEIQRQLIRDLQAVETLDLQPDMIGSKHHPERASIDWYLK